MNNKRRAVLIAGSLVASGLWRAAKAQATLVVGYIYVGPRNDFGYNQTHATAAKRVALLEGVKVVEQESVPESDAVASVMEAMIVQDGAKIIYPTSFGYYNPYVLDMARKYPDVYFRHAGGSWQEGHPINIGSYKIHMHEGQYLAGYLAGKKAINGQIGFVASFRYPSILRNVNAFALGCKVANPDAKIRVVFTGSWSDPVQEAEAVNVMIDQGAKVIGCSIDSAKTVVEVAKRRNVHSCGYNHSMAEIGGASYLGGAVPNWSVINIKTVKQVKQNTQPPNKFAGGLADGLVKCDVGQGIGSSVKKGVKELEDELVTGKRWIWSGLVKDNEGNTRIAEGQRIDSNDPILQKLDWFVEGVQA